MITEPCIYWTSLIIILRIGTYTIWIIVISLILPGCDGGVVDRDELSTPTNLEKPLTTDKLPELTLDDAATILNIYPILPNTFKHNSQVGEASVSDLLGTGSKSEMFIEGQLPSLSAEGEVIETRPWCQIQGAYLLATDRYTRPRR